MPKKFIKSKKTFRKKGPSKKGYRKKTPMYKSVATEGMIVPDRARMKLRYFAQKTYSLATNTYFAFTANSLFDPDTAVGGNQPVGFDQWSAFFNRYRVKACKIKVNIVQTTALAGNIAQWVLIPTTDYSGTVAQTVITNAQQPYAQTRFSSVNSSSAGVISMKSYMTTKRISGVKSSAVADDDVWSASTAGNPFSTWYFVLQANSLDNVSNLSAYADFTLTFYCEMYSRKPLLAS